MTKIGFILLAALACWNPFTARANDWPGWRGPDHNGISTEKGWLDHWPDSGPEILWKKNVGIGFSSMAVAQGRVFTLGNANSTDTVFCFDATTGKELWKHSYEADLGDKFFEGGTTSTPTVDGDRVYTSSRWGDVFCFEAATGKILWSKNVQKETGVRIPTWGFSGSPLIHGNLVVFNIGEAGLALDKATGKIQWQSANKDAGYSTPLPLVRDGKTIALIGSGQSYLAVDVESGKELWRFRWLTQYGVNASDPVVSGDQVFISTGYGKGCALLKLGVGEPEVVWKSKVLRTQTNPSVLVGGFLYGIDGDTTDKAMLKCVQLSDGAEKWAAPEIGSGSVTVADGKLIVFTDHGELMVAPANPESFKPSARAQILGGKCWTVPVLANGRIYCRNARGDLACVNVQGKQ